MDIVTRKMRSGVIAKGGSSLTELALATRERKVDKLVEGIVYIWYYNYNAQSSEHPIAGSYSTTSVS